MAAAAHQLAVSAIDRLTPDCVTVTFAVPEELAADYAFAAGQHVSLRSPAVGGDVRRSYSVCTPAGSGVLRVAVKLLPGGRFSGWVHEALHPGDLLEVLTPTGRFTTGFDPHRSRHYCFIAAGSGITPVLSLIATALAVEPGSTVTLLYGNRTTSSVLFVEELADLKNSAPDRLHLVTLLSRELPAAPLLAGRLDAGKLAELFDVLVSPQEVDEWFLCGPAGLIDAATESLAAHQVDPASVHRELFHVGPPAPLPATLHPQAECELTFALGGRSVTVEVANGSSLLDAARSVRPDAPFACTNGVCGTCRAKVVAGEVVMRQNYALEAAELSAGFVLTCQSVPVTPQVTIDYDG